MSTSELRQISILIVEDDAEVQKAAERAYRALLGGVAIPSITVCGTLGEAKKVLGRGSNRFSLLHLDLNVRGDGLEVLRHAVKVGAINGVILYTGASWDGMYQEWLEGPRSVVVATLPELLHGMLPDRHLLISKTQGENDHENVLRSALTPERLVALAQDPAPRYVLEILCNCRVDKAGRLDPQVRINVQPQQRRGRVVARVSDDYARLLLELALRYPANGLTIDEVAGIYYGSAGGSGETAYANLKRQLKTQGLDADAVVSRQGGAVYLAGDIELEWRGLLPPPYKMVRRKEDEYEVSSARGRGKRLLNLNDSQAALLLQAMAEVQHRPLTARVAGLDDAAFQRRVDELRALLWTGGLALVAWGLLEPVGDGYQLVREVYAPKRSAVGRGRGGESSMELTASSGKSVLDDLVEAEGAADEDEPVNRSRGGAGSGRRR